MAGIGNADMNGADMNGPEGGHAIGGLLSPLARAQYAALAGLRWRTFVNGLRSHLGAFELGARTVFYLIYSAMGLGLGAAMGAFAYQFAYRHRWQLFPILFWVTCLIWQVVPIMLASFQEQFDLGSLLRFPVGFRPFFLLYVVFGLSDMSTILGGLCCAGIWIGVTVARPELFAWTALVLMVFAAFNILLVRAIFAWIDRWLAQRRTREILAALFMVFVLVYAVAESGRVAAQPSRAAEPPESAADSTTARRTMGNDRQRGARMASAGTHSSWFAPSRRRSKHSRAGIARSAWALRPRRRQRTRLTPSRRISRRESGRGSCPEKNSRNSR